MARRSKKRNKGDNNRNRNNQIKRYNNFQDIPNTNRTSTKNKLYLHKNLEYILLEILKKGKDPISERLISDSKKDNVPIRISWLNITKSNEHLSYVLPSKVKDIGDEWKKENRVPIPFRKLIRKLYSKTFSNNQIKSFISKFKNSYNNFTKKPKKDFSPDNKILDNLMIETVDGDLKWNLESTNHHFDRYDTSIFITDKKHVLIQFYNMKDYDVKSFISLRLVTNGDEEFMKSITDNELIDDLKIFIVQ